MRVAIPHMRESVAPCLEYCATMALFTIVDGEITDRVDFRLSSREPLDRVRLVRDQKIDTIICGGVQDVLEDMLRASGVEVISWVSGPIYDLLELFLRGQLVSCNEHRNPMYGLESS